MSSWPIAGRAMFMVSHFGWKAAIAVLINAGAATLLFRRELGPMGRQGAADVP